ncbi:hypothetical protein INT47_010003 [Mucor saturninus]|uniref:HTH myb-type domain-containing protein n=1 Tax=Mucor saturninus TaxID=64648 RepID=A0A8H7QLP3_9FUNG|nr:hypothetical protein INT47_010003 [Mucor saturninus]
MTDAATKRRKIRPNNVIALNKALNQIPTPTAPPPAAEKVTPIVEKVKDIESTSEADKAEKKAQRKADKKAAKKATRKAKKRKAKVLGSDNEQTEPVKQADETPKVVEPVVTTPSKPKLSTPVAKSYSSASDSDETDDERRTLYTQKIKQQKIEKQKTEQQRIEKQKAEKQKEAAAAAASEVGQLSQKKKATEKKVIAKTRVEKKKIEKKKSSKVVTPDSQSDSESEDETAPTKKKTVSKIDIKLDTPHRDASRLVSNRISFRKTREFDAKKTGAENVKERLSDLFVPEVNDNYFVSDSESDTDSGEDYEVKEYPTWQRNLSRNHDQATDPWPVQRKFGYSDTLKLEKRIKKICRREGITFQGVQEIFTKDCRTEYIKFFQKIAKPFPNVSLNALARQCKNMYHQKKKNVPWTPEDVKQLEELLKVYGQSPIVISQHMDRSPKNISDYLYTHGATERKSLQRWSNEEDILLAKEASKLDMTEKRLDYSPIVKAFDGTRTMKQIHARFYRLRHLIQPDGTLAEKRNATPYEELKYLKKLLAQVKEHKLVEESQLDYTKDRGFVDKSFYLSNRALIKGFETMKIKGKEIKHQ